MGNGSDEHLRVAAVTIRGYPQFSIAAADLPFKLQNSLTRLFFARL